MKIGPKGGKGKDKDKGRQPAPVVEEEPEEQDLMQQGETEAEGDNRGDSDQSEAHSDVDEEPIAAGLATKMKTNTRPGRHRSDDWGLYTPKVAMRTHGDARSSCVFAGSSDHILRRRTISYVSSIYLWTGESYLRRRMTVLRTFTALTIF